MRLLFGTDFFRTVFDSTKAVVSIQEIYSLNGLFPLWLLLIQYYLVGIFLVDAFSGSMSDSYVDAKAKSIFMTPVN